MLRTFLWVMVVGIALGAASLLAQDAVLDHFYGQGVHKFFARNYVGAFEDFNTAIDNGSDDPRCYYFRGLTYLQLGREDEAKADFEKGSQLEMQAAGKFFNVSKALERIQGRQRMMIEQYRTKARLAVMVELERQRKARYEELRREEARVLDQSAPPVGIPEATPAPAPAAQPAAPAQPMQPPAAEPPAPAAQPAAPAAAPAPAAEPAAPAAPAQPPAAPAPAAEPAAPPAAPATPPASTNPFATEPAAPAQPAMPAQPEAPPAPAQPPAAEPAAPAPAAEPAAPPAPAVPPQPQAPAEPPAPAQPPAPAAPAENPFTT